MHEMLRERYAEEWLDHMRRGDFDAAWRTSDAIRQLPSIRNPFLLPRHFQTIWNGAPLKDKRVLVRCYHGLGDTLQFIRYARLIKEIAREVIVWVQPQLIPLLRSMGSIDQLLPLHDGAPKVDYDVDLEVMELPYVFRTTAATLPIDIPYLHVEPITQSHHANLQVGLVWRAGDWNEARSIPFELLAPLQQIPNIDWRIFQHEAERAGWNGQFGTKVGGADILEDARSMRALDLMISIDSMPAHLAGALGVPTWTLLAHRADWRWQVDCEQCHWYPQMRLLRQPRNGDWLSVIKRVTIELDRLQLSRFSFSHTESYSSARNLSVGSHK